MENLVLFENNPIRRVYGILNDGIIVDVYKILTDNPVSRNYWSVLKTRFIKEGNKRTTICSPLKMKANDRKMSVMDRADAEGFLRIIQSIPSPKAEPFKLWLVRVGYERLKEIDNHEIAKKDDD